MHPEYSKRLQSYVDATWMQVSAHAQADAIFEQEPIICQIVCVCGKSKLRTKDFLLRLKFMNNWIKETKVTQWILFRSFPQCQQKSSEHSQTMNNFVVFLTSDFLLHDVMGKYHMCSCLPSSYCSQDGIPYMFWFSAYFFQQASAPCPKRNWPALRALTALPEKITKLHCRHSSRAYCRTLPEQTLIWTFAFRGSKDVSCCFYEDWLSKQFIACKMSGPMFLGFALRTRLQLIAASGTSRPGCTVKYLRIAYCSSQSHEAGWSGSSEDRPVYTLSFLRKVLKAAFKPEEYPQKAWSFHRFHVLRVRQGIGHTFPPHTSPIVWKSHISIFAPSCTILHHLAPLQSTATLQRKYTEVIFVYVVRCCEHLWTSSSPDSCLLSLLVYLWRVPISTACSWLELAGMTTTCALRIPSRRC